MAESQLLKSKAALEAALADMETNQKNGDYLAAQRCKEESERLKSEISKLESKVLRFQQERDIKDINSFHEEQNEMFEDKWTRFFADLEQEGEKLLSDQKKAHAEELDQAETDFNEELKTFHESGMVLSLKQQEKALAKQQKQNLFLFSFKEAHLVQTERKKLEESEKANWENLLQQKLKSKLRKIGARQEQERAALNKKLDTKKDEANREKARELEEMQKKQKNTRSECKSIHEKENLTSQKKIKNVETASSKLGSTSRLKSPVKNIFSQKKIKNGGETM